MTVIGIIGIAIGWWMVSTRPPDLLWDVNAPAAVLMAPTGVLVIILGVVSIAMSALAVIP